ncbi:DUF2721 domain-containing protein [Ensifer adhaerens]|jgi:hypothetical protein|uniref:DUF2721 domain-containing protein n=2 Tax=Ensifer adhaerens TaxID=106592 RepID=A0ABY8HR58_ENSAD|nr:MULTISPECIES: DUF2721 domain-containing protein [Ensifer]KSV82146.1 hypothetical protein N182_15165 [Sinorhizobium sp. GL2]MCY1746010.1 DUF2721 domain-containing protein [Ensifer sp. SL37]MDF8357158.1 DUF2721 domain-containing protein [Ensifer adhaerens]UCM24737.1 DUF2721 domain-containing protein [Ensifer adhaerens]UTV40390.1 DUF2721 domain-containing protein [Ensifer adhaerens]
MKASMETPSTVIDLASIVQTSLAPVFLLAGTAGFVSVYASRLGRVSDRVNEIGEKYEQNDARRMQLDYLRRRTLALEIAVALGTFAAICTGCAILNLLAGALAFGFREENLFWFFGGAIVSLIGSLLAFLFEMLIAGRNMLRQMRMDQAASGGD